jgi:GntR family transcriptional regulator, transcriptional repressor for pyruvate dehydrogenase complex
MSVHALFKDEAGSAPARRGGTLSSQIVGDIREKLFSRQLKPGDPLGGEKDIAGHFGVSRIVARDALRTLEALGIVEIKVGSGGGARITQGNPRLFAEALAVQLDLAGAEAHEIMDAQRAVECVTAELAAENANAADLRNLKRWLAHGAETIRDADAYTRSCQNFHLAIAEASHNRVLVVQLISLQHVAWPLRNRTLTPVVADHIQKVHGELVDLIEARDAAAARRLMDEHVKMIRARRVAERGNKTRKPKPASCC